ncbi:MAG: hypothetical protein RJA22_226 [Verrucomicrobiota bacterium]
MLIGFLLSPLSWWNDLFVNVPLALGFAWLVALVYPPAFTAAAVVGYWLTNVLGFVLMHRGLRQARARDGTAPPPRESLRRDLLISLAYTVLILILLKLGFVRPPGKEFGN